MYILLENIFKTCVISDPLGQNPTFPPVVIIILTLNCFGCEGLKSGGLTDG